MLTAAIWLAWLAFAVGTAAVGAMCESMTQREYTWTARLAGIGWGVSSLAAILATIAVNT